MMQMVRSLHSFSSSLDYLSPNKTEPTNYKGISRMTLALVNRCNSTHHTPPYNHDSKPMGWGVICKTNFYKFFDATS